MLFIWFYPRRVEMNSKAPLGHCTRDAESGAVPRVRQRPCRRWRPESRLVCASL